ncbi:unnamed protein product [Cochlearia groenlandica]
MNHQQREELGLIEQAYDNLHEALTRKDVIFSLPSVALKSFPDMRRHMEMETVQNARMARGWSSLIIHLEGDRGRVTVVVVRHGDMILGPPFFPFDRLFLQHSK